MGGQTSVSKTDDTQAERGDVIGADKIILGVLGVLLIGVLFFVSSQRQQELRSSPSGLDGLQVWLASEGQAARNFVGGWEQNPDEIGMLVLPLYDTDLFAERLRPQTDEELILQQDEYDLLVDPILSKAGSVSTMVVLPKWRTGMRLTGIAHPLLIAEEARVTDTLNALLTFADAQLVYAQRPFLEFAYSGSEEEDFTATIYAAQMFAASGCRPIIGAREAMILGACKLFDGTILYVLSDPDLINNHGLALGDNAFIIRDFIAETAGEKQVIIDYSRENWLARAIGGVQRERSWSDLKQFFAPPFSLMWIGLIVAVLLTLWRSATRFGPLIQTGSAIGASKMMAIGARARLMRLSGRDGALVGDYSTARLAAAATTLVGAAHASQISTPEAFLTYTKRRHPQFATALTEALNTISALPQGASSGQAMAAVANLDRILEQITHDT